MFLICFSRLLVGFYKQTYTLTTTILTSNTDSRSKVIGQISAILTTGWILGPSVGSWISGHGGKMYIPAISSTMMFFNYVICKLFFPSSSSPSSPSKLSKKSSPKKSKLISPIPLPILPSFLSLLLLRFLTSTTYTLNLKSYHLNKYNIPLTSMGYYSSYTSVLSLVTNLWVLPKSGGFIERGYRRITIATFCLLLIFLSVLSEFLTLRPSIFSAFSYHIFVYLPVYTISYSLASSTLKTELNWRSKCEGRVGEVMGSLDFCMNGVGVFSPVWRAKMLRDLGRGEVYNELVEVIDEIIFKVKIFFA
ncbi:hypothetical protein TL16_g03006, partial [Triparma laevis f. inornata]